MSIVAAPEEPRPRPDVPWESSFDDALTLARAQDRPLVVYYRGSGLGLGVPYYDAWVQLPEFAQDTSTAIKVVCDKLRRTFYDRRRDGRRILAPRWGAVTCGEHVRCAEEFERWYTEREGHGPGADEEGLHVLIPGSDEFVKLTRFEQLAELCAGASSIVAAPPPFEAIEAALAGPAGRREAEELVSDRSRAARDRVEEILWSGFDSGPVQEVLVRALAADDQRSSRELLAACVRQGSQPELARLALEHWPEGRDLWPVWFAARWHLDGGSRQAAWRVLERDARDDLSLRARGLFEEFVADESISATPDR